jgi:hypothetical protein
MTVSDTSIKAYKEHQEEGKVGKQAQFILSNMKYPFDYSRRELSQMFNLELSSVCGRVNELLQIGLLEEMPARQCKITKKTIHPVKLKQPSLELT